MKLLSFHLSFLKLITSTLIDSKTVEYENVTAQLKSPDFSMHNQLLTPKQTTPATKSHYSNRWCVAASTT